MKKSIKITVLIWVAAALASMLLFSIMTTVNTFNIGRSQQTAVDTSSLLSKAESAEVAHY